MNMLQKEIVKQIESIEADLKQYFNESDELTRDAYIKTALRLLETLKELVRI